ncbi:transposase [Sphingomonas sp. CGMCC 1.13654]|uniref:Transposase n=1 Tax=Sphingomonas chungangi TaxID=2683589 RepID=A0A838L5B9_9SPHN|nr:transposase [Sphingomonas chungangi]MBA2934561.1 transposase [Sphingomonas chungangi]
MVFSRKLSRWKLLDFFAKLPACLVAMEACGGAHCWARELRTMGHEIRLIPPVYVRPFVKRHKNDAVDAEAICEAVQRPSMRFVAIKSEEQQAAGMVFRTRWVAPRGLAQVAMLADLLDDSVVAARGGAGHAARHSGHARRARRPNRRPRQRDRQARSRG